MIALHGLHKRYGDHTALHPTDLEVRKGEAWGLLGANGSGKSTLLGLVCGLRVPTAGSATIDAMQTRDPASRVHLGVLPERPALPGHLTLRRFLRALGRDPGSLTERLGLTARLDARMGTLSAGQAQRAALTVALAGNPRWLLLDEPLTALDAERCRAVVTLVGERVAAGCGVLLATHRPTEWASVLTHRAHLDSGRLTDPVST